MNWSWQYNFLRQKYLIAFFIVVISTDTPDWTRTAEIPKTSNLGAFTYQLYLLEYIE